MVPANDDPSHTILVHRGKGAENWEELSAGERGGRFIPEERAERQTPLPPILKHTIIDVSSSVLSKIARALGEI